MSELLVVTHLLTGLALFGAGVVSGVAIAVMDTVRSRKRARSREYQEHRRGEEEFDFNDF